MTAVFGWLVYCLLGLTLLINLLVLHEVRCTFIARDIREPHFIRSAFFFNGFMGIIMGCTASLLGRYVS